MTSDDRRAALAKAKIVNGIDFVEVDPTDDTALVVHFILNLPGASAGAVPPDPADALGADNFVITGGERITSITVQSATMVADNQMRVVVDKPGDYSVYCLALQGNNNGVPPGFDPASACGSFIFHINCPANFDCQITQHCPPDAVTPPPINYLAKDYPSMVQVMLDRLSLLTPAWTERNAADLGVALVETLAYVGDQLSYREDVIATEAYLGTARLRTSARRHARLVDYFIAEGRNARAWIRIQLGSSWPDGNTLPAATRCCTWYPGASAPVLPHDTVAYQQAVTAGAVFFETGAVSSPLFQKHWEMPLYAWSDTQACLARGATHATLAGSFPDLAAGMMLVLAEVIGPLTGDRADANPANRQVVRLTNVVVGTDPLSNTDITEIDWATEDALNFVLCLSSLSDDDHGNQPVTGVSAAWGNIVLADQGRAVGAASDPLSTGPESLGVVPANGRFRPRLANPDVTFAVPLPDAAAPAATAATAVGTPMPVITALVSTDPQTRRQTPWNVATGQNLLDEGGDDLASKFIVEVENDSTAYLLFGDGIDGAQPTSGDSFTVAYRVGNGTSGNVGRDTVTLIDTPPGVAHIVGVTNPLPAWGGVDPETVEHVRQSAPVAFQTQKRAVTAHDYETLTMAYPGVQRAAATLRWTGSWHTVFITVERDQQAAVDGGFIAGLEAYLDGYRMAGVDLEVQDGVQVPLLIQMKVCAAADYVAADVRQALLAVFNADLLPDGTPGLFNTSRFVLGQPFYLSPLIAAAQRIDGVSAVRVCTFERQDQPGIGGLSAGVLIPQPLEFFVLANDANYPERGRFDLTVEGGQ
ncbi:hypothetical protein BOO86_01435 [Mycobacterium sp. CBMA 234]|uniref:baseplate J/gp47 family protein n=1 Tax=Mycolicibacterium sp. CBMA 234 TaxID=1918495 RepID=UPI0012DD564A|nr:baseplate J/gp47 family protein [Mycolicibacterium sp. CBMA 234]MUL63112.1 hypothetical protein [Mycolicibacterium sp. CBMA 234]